MTRIQLNLYLDPAFAEVTLNLKRKDGEYEKIVGVIDTGAMISQFPQKLLEIIESEAAETSRVVVQRAGITTYEATETDITLFLEDATGAKTRELQIRAWFADTDEVLIGFEDVLNRATLYIDYRSQREGWLEID